MQCEALRLHKRAVLMYVHPEHTLLLLVVGRKAEKKGKEEEKRKKQEGKTYNCKTLCEGDQSVTVVVTFVIRVYTLARHDCKRINSCLCLCLCYCKSCQGAQYFHHVARSYFFESVCFDKSLSVDLTSWAGPTI